MCPFGKYQMTRSVNKYLYLRGEDWNNKRNVPKQIAHIEPRAHIRISPLAIAFLKEHSGK